MHRRFRIHPVVAYSLALFLSAFSLFLLEPLVAKRLLPLWGGTASVWVTCMVFFQAMLFAGYLYAHLTRLHFSPRGQVSLHLVLLGLSLLSLPLGFYPKWHPIAGLPPVLALLCRLALGIGLPFFTLSATAPLLQHWFALSSKGRNPYPLYCASNLGSFIALLGYPTMVEPRLGIHVQGMAMGGLLLGLTALIAYCAWQVEIPAELEGVKRKMGPEGSPSVWDRLRWVLLSFIPSSVLLGVTSYFSVDIGSIPLLWVLPLALYLFSFVLAFSGMPRVIGRGIARIMPFAVIGLLLAAAIDVPLSIGQSLLLHMGVFFLVAMALHGELAALRPGSDRLTSFYLWLSLGGLLGGLFNSLIAPYLFVTPMEYPLALAGACGVLFLARTVAAGGVRKRAIAIDLGLALVAGSLVVWLETRWLSNIVPSPRAFIWIGARCGLFPWAVKFVTAALICAGLAVFKRRLAVALVVIVFAWAGLRPAPDLNGEIVVARERNFFGVLEVRVAPLFGYLKLINGTTVHGMQSIIPEFQKYPLAYFHPRGPVGDLFYFLGDTIGHRDIGVIGLGAGSLAAYGQSGQKITFFEIDDKVVNAAIRQFSYLSNSRADFRIVKGDGRLKLEEVPDGSFGLLFADAFSSDSVPVHLLTKEAMALYFRKVWKGGLVAVNVTNRHIRLEPIVGRLASELGLSGAIREDKGDDATYRLHSSWIVLARDPESLGPLVAKGEWRPLALSRESPLWTDDFTSYYSLIDFRSTKEN